jgi:hypothetical protein
MAIVSAAPTQFCSPVSLVELPHSEEVSLAKAADTRFPSGNVAGQLVHCALAPLSSGYPAADNFADLPVKDRSARY